MKRISFVLGIVVLLFTIPSCNSNNNTPTDNNYMRCKLNGTPWESNPNDVGAIYNSSAGMVTFSGQNSTALITANLAGISGTGNFPMGVGTTSAMSINMNSQFYYINVDFGSGTFHLDEIKGSGSSHDFEGRFEGVATNSSNDTIIISEGTIETF